MAHVNRLQAERPFIKDDYGVPKHEKDLLTWSWLSARMAAARNYWVHTTRPDGRPHARPVWGVWIDDTLYFGGGPQTRWSRNLAHNPAVTVHLESGAEVVIFEGTAVLDDAPDLQNRVDDAYELKYDIRHGPPIRRLVPRVAFAWHNFPQDMTRWRFTTK